ncbi:unnamed protein product [Amoebophrya sp. A120]|nr:unnamed protein product [Amoebophrya sp. A120]|eukprot:GSA120T00002732001.1
MSSRGRKVSPCALPLLLFVLTQTRNFIVEGSYSSSFFHRLGSLGRRLRVTEDTREPLVLGESTPSNQRLSLFLARRAPDSTSAVLPETEGGEDDARVGSSGDLQQQQARAVQGTTRREDVEMGRDNQYSYTAPVEWEGYSYYAPPEVVVASGPRPAVPAELQVNAPPGLEENERHEAFLPRHDGGPAPQLGMRPIIQPGQEDQDQRLLLPDNAAQEPALESGEAVPRQELGQQFPVLLGSTKVLRESGSPGEESEDSLFLEQLFRVRGSASKVTARCAALLTVLACVSAGACGSAVVLSATTALRRPASSPTARPDDSTAAVWDFDFSSGDGQQQHEDSSHRFASFDQEDHDAHCAAFARHGRFQYDSTSRDAVEDQFDQYAFWLDIGERLSQCLQREQRSAVEQVTMRREEDHAHLPSSSLTRPTKEQDNGEGSAVSRASNRTNVSDADLDLRQTLLGRPHAAKHAVRDESPPPFGYARGELRRKQDEKETNHSTIPKGTRTLSEAAVTVVPNPFLFRTQTASSCLSVPLHNTDAHVHFGPRCAVCVTDLHECVARTSRRAVCDAACMGLGFGLPVRDLRLQKFRPCLECSTQSTACWDRFQQCLLFVR